METKLPVVLEELPSYPDEASVRNLNDKPNFDFENQTNNTKIINNGLENNSENKLVEEKKSRSQNPCSTTFIDFCESSSIHGVQYIKQRTFFERFLWLCIVAIACRFCGYYIADLFDKWYESPVFVSFESKSKPVWNIEFPAITICPNRQFSRNDFDFFAELLSAENKNISSEVKSYLETVGQVCIQNEEIPDMKKKFFQIDGFNETLKMSYFLDQFHSLYKKRYNNEVELSYCRWALGEYEDDCFGTIFTESGLCKTVNLPPPQSILRKKAIHEDTFFKRTESDDNKIKHGMGSGMKHGLDIVFTEAKKDVDYDITCTGPIQGYQLVLHSTNEFGDVANQFIQVPLGEQVLISIKPRIFSASKNIIKYPVEIRQCYFQKERYLQFFKNYNQRNCKTECLANHTLEKCGCIPYYLPKEKMTPICGLPKVECYQAAEEEINQLEHEEDFDYVVDEREEKCNCLPDCNSISYDTEMNDVENNYEKLFSKALHGMPTANETEEEAIRNSYKNIIITKFSIYYKEDQFFTSRRSELYSTIDIVSQCGGLLGLFMGVSLISILEIVYFLTVRLFFNIRRN